MSVYAGTMRSFGDTASVAGLLKDDVDGVRDVEEESDGLIVYLTDDATLEDVLIDVYHRIRYTTPYAIATDSQRTQSDRRLVLKEVDSS